MKKLLVYLTLLIALSLCFGDLLNGDESFIGGIFRDLTDGSMAYSVRTVTYNGNYAPDNAGAIWITNSQNQFVKTIKKWASGYQYTLIRWIASSGQNTTGAITSASLPNHQLHNITWNGKNYQGIDAPDGDYKVNIEFTEHNASSGNMGKFKQVTFTKGSAPVNLTIPNESYFTNMSLTWTPVIVNGTLTGTVTSMGGTPISGAVIMAGSSSVFSAENGSYSLSLIPGLWNVSCIVDGYITQEVTNVEITAANTYTLNFSMDSVSIDDELNNSAALKLSQAFPNPFANCTSLNFAAKVPGTLTATVFDIKGRKIRKLTAESATSIAWDGRDNYGRYCVNGIYFIKVRSGNSQATRKVILQK
ncbi:MAG: hypothetical protein CVU50_00865 [Candidatus Cloacimonetes bacterium HGW-Cloacimonetes-3]|jgi:flagellar hook assembly protein FlgD|nr:MAG: hypothetical protein CVU50_00865 [Candidatus Cloacimonetes bacterium HGW-Cloacimonetes-3]